MLPPVFINQQDGKREQTHKPCDEYARMFFFFYFQVLCYQCFFFYFRTITVYDVRIFCVLNFVLF